MSEADTSEGTPTGREIWIEKYRPETLDDIYGQTDIIERLQSYVERQELPHLLFSGPAGIGKCVTGDTPVLTSDGLTPIADVVGSVEGFGRPDPHLKVCTLTDTATFRFVSPSHVFAQTSERLIRVQTVAGGEMRVTPEHKFLTRGKNGVVWQPAARLSDGTAIARPASLPAPPVPSSALSSSSARDIGEAVRAEHPHPEAIPASSSTTALLQASRSTREAFLEAVFGGEAYMKNQSTAIESEWTPLVSYVAASTGKETQIVERTTSQTRLDIRPPSAPETHVGARRSNREAYADGGAIYFDTVEAIDTLSEPTRVYDLTVPQTRNYVGGRLPTVLHNTTSATAIARAVYGEDWRGNFLELNASDERGIDVVRDRIKSFARSSFGGYDHRIIFLDEADSLTDYAQSALRRTMEQFADNTRFILSCNYSSKIIDPIQSRCAVFRFTPLDDEAIANQLRDIASAESIEMTENGLDALVYAASGDMRRGINSLQAAATTGTVVDEETVYTVTSTARPEQIEAMVTAAIEGDFTTARSDLETLLVETGMAGSDVIDQLHRIAWNLELDQETTVRLLERIGEADYRITVGGNERVQLEALLATLAAS